MHSKKALGTLSPICTSPRNTSFSAAQLWLNPFAPPLWPSLWGQSWTSTHLFLIRILNINTFCNLLRSTYENLSFFSVRCLSAMTKRSCFTSVIYFQCIISLAIAVIKQSPISQSICCCYSRNTVGSLASATFGFGVKEPFLKCREYAPCLIASAPSRERRAPLLWEIFFSTQKVWKLQVSLVCLQKWPGKPSRCPPEPSAASSKICTYGG